MTTYKPVEAQLITDAKAVVDCVQRDDCGQLIGQIWMGGNGGLLSNDTLRAVDRLRKTLAELENGQERSSIVMGERE